MSPEARSLRWLTLAVLLPLLVLAGLGLLGIRAQRQAAWSAAREEAESIAARRASLLANDLAARVEKLPLFPDPPPPGPPAPEADPLAGSDPQALARLRDDPRAGLSPAGLPRRALAALRLRLIDPAAQPGAELVELVSRRAPSILSRPVLEELAEREPSVARAALERWHREDLVRAEWRRADGAGWHSGERGWWWFEPAGSELLYLAPEVFRAILAAQPSNDREPLPRWAKLGFAGSLMAPGGPDESEGELLAAAAVPFGNGLRLEVRGIASAIERDVRRQAGWMLGVLGTAVAVSAVALLLIHRLVHRERRLGELKGQFVSSVSHELRAPVGSIRLMAEALHQGKVSGEPAREFHRLIAGEAARLSHLVENVLDFARIEEGRKRYRFEESDLQPLVADAIALLEPPAAERGVRLVRRLDECCAMVDATAIHQAVVNLLDNAIKFSPQGGTVEIVLAKAGSNHWQLAIRDEGPGIPASERERIFERFHRLGNELRRETQGTGIGLSIVKHIAAAHGGRVNVASSEGHGSVFTLRAPVGAKPCRADTATAHNESAAAGSTPHEP